MLNRTIQTTLLPSGTLIRMGTLRCVLVRQMTDRRSSNLSQRTQKLSRGVGKCITHYDVAFVDAKYDMALQCIGKFGTVYDAVRNRIYTYRYPHISSSCNERYNSIQGVYLFVRVTEAGPPISSTGCCTDKRCTQMVWFYWK